MRYDFPYMWKIKTIHKTGTETDINTENNLMVARRRGLEMGQKEERKRRQTSTYK